MILIDASKSAGGDFSDRTQLLCETERGRPDPATVGPALYANRAASERDGMQYR